MKNLRKILAMVLVVAMAFSFAAVASAKYTDDSSIKYSTAVGVLSGIGAINGKPDGSFDPTASVTRAEAAKMVTYAILGTQLANVLPAVSSTFKDVPASHWASKYIEYLVSMGIIGGRGDGTFDPSGEVTAVQLAKMLLSAVGYGKNNEYTGSSWSFKVVQDAFTNNVFAGSAATNYSKAATREEAALYIFNAIMNIEKVSYSKTNDVYTSIGAGKTIASIVFGMTTDTGALTLNATNSNNTTTTINGHVYNIATPYSLLGHSVKAYYKTAGASGVAYYVEDLSTTVATTATTTAAAFKTSLNAAGVTAFVGAVPSWTNGTNTGNTGAFVLGTTAPGAGSYIVYNGTVVGFVTADTYTIQKVNNYVAPTATAAGKVNITNVKADGTLGAAADITLNTASSGIADNVKLYSGIATGDYVYVDITGTATTVVSKATVVVNSLSSLTATAAVVGGTSYAISSVTDNAGLTNLAAATVGATQRTFVFDKTGAVAGYADYTPASLADTYGVVLATSYTPAVAPAIGNNFVGTYAYATVYMGLSDGTKAIYTYTIVDPTYSATTVDLTKEAFNTAFGLATYAAHVLQTGADLAAKDVVKFSASAAKQLTSVVLQAPTAAATIAAGSALTSLASTYYTANTTFVYWNSANVANTLTAVKGYANAQNALAGAVTVVADATGHALFVYVDGTYAAAVTTQTVAYFRDATYSVTKYDATLAANLFGYTAYVNGVATTLWSQSSLLTPATGTFMAYTMTNGYLTAVAAPASTTAVASKTIAFADSNVIVVDGIQCGFANAQIVTYSASAATVTVGGTLAVGATISGVYTTVAGVNTLTYVVVEAA